MEKLYTMLKKTFWIITFLFIFHSFSFSQNKTTINVGVVNKKAIHLPKPRITNHFRVNEEQIVAVQIIIDESGKVITTHAILGHALLRSSCENAARQAKFHPTLISPGPLKITALIIYKFKPDGTIETNIDSNDEILIGKAAKFVDPPNTDCNCKFGVGIGQKTTVMVQVETDKQGNVTKATAISGHQALRYSTEKAALGSKFLPINLKTQFTISYNFIVADKWSAKFHDYEIKNAETWGTP